MPRLVALLLGLAFLSAVAGCGSGPRFADVEGRVTLNGKPLADLEVLFLPDPKEGTLGPPSSAYTDELGHYRLATNKGQSGAVVGTHRVTLRDLTTLPTPPVPDAEGNRPKAAKPPSKVSRIPTSYASSHETPLRAIEVKPGGQTFDFEVGSGPKK